MTGDFTRNPSASCLVMTTEVLLRYPASKHPFEPHIRRFFDPCSIIVPRSCAKSLGLSSMRFTTCVTKNVVLFGKKLSSSFRILCAMPLSLPQLIGACHYMHTRQVIHRDLKLGNLFLDADMNIKVGVFGLAALIESPGERKKIICGTRNYIAQEVLFDTANGHSFEVDTWSIGVILYTFVVGRPPSSLRTSKKFISEFFERCSPVLC